MSEAIIISPSETEQFLREKYGSGISDVKQLGAGAWSHAFSFEHEGIRNVIRWSNVVGNFERDAIAASFHRDGLPIPPITDVGKAHNKFFAISPFAAGVYLEILSAEELESTVPAIFRMFRALRSVDLSTMTGFGLWDKEGRGSHDSWKEFLRDDKNDLEGSLINGWRPNLQNSSMGTDVYERLWGRFEPLVNFCPEDRGLVHSDLLNHNVLAEDGSISAVLDWGSSIYGDSLFDVAWFLFYEPWYPHFSEVNLLQRILEDYKADPTTNKTNIDERLLCYKLNIGLDSIAYNAFKQDWEHAQEAADYTVKIAS